MEPETHAVALGTIAGKNAAGWRFDGNTDLATYRAFLAGYRHGDPAVTDAYEAPAWLSGEWSDSQTPASLMRELGLDADHVDADWLATEYEDAANEAYWYELKRVAMLHVQGWRKAPSGG